MPVRDFKQIKPVDIDTSISALQFAGQQIGGGFDALQSAIKQQRQGFDTQFDRAIATNTESVQANLERIKNLKDLNVADEAGQFGIDALRKGYGQRIDIGQVGSSVEAARERLRSQAYSGAAGAGEEVAIGTEDITQGTQTVYQQLIDKGARPDWARQKATEWVKGAKSLQTGFDKAKDIRTEETLSTMPRFDNEEQVRTWADKQTGIDKNAIYRRGMQGITASRAEIEYQDTQTNKRNTKMANEAIGRYTDFVTKGGSPSNISQFTEGLNPQQNLLFQRGRVNAVNNRQRLTKEQDRDYTKQSEAITRTNRIQDTMAKATIDGLIAERDELPTVPDISNIFGVKLDLVSVVDTIADQATGFNFSHRSQLNALHAALVPKYGPDGASAVLARGFVGAKAASKDFMGQGIDIERIKKQILIHESINTARTAASEKIVQAQQQNLLRQVQQEDATASYLENYHDAQVEGKSLPTRSTSKSIFGSPLKTDPKEDILGKRTSEEDEPSKKTIIERPSSTWGSKVRGGPLTKDILDSLTVDPVAGKLVSAGPLGAGSVMPDMSRDRSLLTRVQDFMGQTQGEDVVRFGEDALQKAIRRTGFYEDNLQLTKNMARRLKDKYPRKSTADLVNMIKKLTDKGRGGK